MNRPAAYNKIALLFIALYSVIQVFCLNQLSPTYDEGSFAAYGATILKFQRQKDVIKYESKLPITALNMLPRAIEQVFDPALDKTMEESITDIIYGRYVSLLVTIFLGLLIFKWTSQLYNSRTGLFSLLLFLLCPNFLAHGIFVSSDIFAAFFMTLSLYYLWKFANEQKTGHLIIMSFATALAQISKFSMVHLFILIPVLLFAFRFLKKETPSLKKFTFKRSLGHAALFLFINWLIICTAHFFYQVFLPMSDYSFMSSTFKNWQPAFSWLPIPLPSSYLCSLDAVMYFDQLGGGVQNSLNGAPYILGQTSIKGFWFYYFVVLLFKVPIPILLVWLGSLFLIPVNFKRSFFFRHEIFLLLPVLYFLIYMNFFYSTQVGIRHIIIIFPLLFVFAGRFITKIFESKKQFILYLMLIYTTISVCNYFPHFLPYTNEFIMNKKLAYRKIADTNLCYGEGKNYLEKYLTENPEAILLPEKPISGKIVMEVNEMLNMNIRTVGKYDWIHELIPVDHIHSQYLIFEVTGTKADSLQKIRH